MNAGTVEKFFLAPAAIDAEMVRNILKSAAHLVAAMKDCEQGVKIESLSLEVRDSLDILQEELDAAHLLDAYKVNEDGGLRV